MNHARCPERVAQSFAILVIPVRRFEQIEVVDVLRIRAAEGRVVIIARVCVARALRERFGERGEVELALRELLLSSCERSREVRGQQHWYVTRTVIYGSGGRIGCFRSACGTRRGQRVAELLERAELRGRELLYDLLVFPLLARRRGVIARGRA